MLLVTDTLRPGVARLMDHLALAARTEPETAALLARLPVGVAAVDDLDRKGTATVGWVSPSCGTRHIWTQLPSLISRKAAPSGDGDGVSAHTMTMVIPSMPSNPGPSGI